MHTIFFCFHFVRLAPYVFVLYLMTLHITVNDISSNVPFGKICSREMTFKDIQTQAQTTQQHQQKKQHAQARGGSKTLIQ